MRPGSYKGNQSYWESIEEQADGSLIVTFSAPALEWAASTVLAYGPAVEVLEPPELRRMVAEWLDVCKKEISMNDKTIEWLLQGEAWIQYRTRVDLLGQAETDPQVRAARKAMLADPKIQSLLTELNDWPGAVLNSHKSASQPFHKLAFIADLGLNVSDAPVKKIAKKVMEHQSEQGPFQLTTNVPTHFGGSGKDEWAWALCDAPILVSALIKMGLGDDKRVQTAIQYLDGLVRDNGFPCAVSPELGKFRGPGRKE